MFNINGPTPVNPIQRASEDNLFLRVNQRVAGDVLNVSNGQVVVEIQGVPIVARLSSPDQMAMLIDRQTAQFLVKEVNSQNIVLQLLPDSGQNQASTPASVHNAPALATSLLSELGVEATPQNLFLAEAALNKGLPIDARLIQEMRTALAGIARWGMEEANIAASLAAAGLPVTESSFLLAKNAPYSVHQDLAQMMETLSHLADQKGLPADMRNWVNQVLDTLREGVLNQSTSPEALRSNLQKTVSLLGRSVENELMGFLKDGTGGNLSATEKGLLALNHLQGELQKSGYSEPAQSIARFLDGVRWMQLTNSASDPAQNQWVQLEIPIQMANPHVKPPLQAESDFETAHLRIARQNENPSQPLDPQNTRLVIQMELADQQSIQIDLTVIQNRIGASISTSTDELCEIAREELDSLSEGLERIGYELNPNQVNVQAVQPPVESTENRAGEITLGAIDLET